jgi:hypothetical protein
MSLLVLSLYIPITLNCTVCPNGISAAFGVTARETRDAETDLDICGDPPHAHKIKHVDEKATPVNLLTSTLRAAPVLSSIREAPLLRKWSMFVAIQRR